MTTYSHFRNRRQAHNVSRSSYDQLWNPFRHVPWDKDGKRVETWNVNQLESQLEPGALTHAASAPPPTTTAETRDDPTSNITSRSVSESVAEENVDDASAPVDTDSRNKEESLQPAIAGTRTDSEYKQPSNGNTTWNGTTPERACKNDTDGKNHKQKKEGSWLRQVHPSTPFTLRNQLQRTFLNSWINLLLVAAPVGIALNFVPGINKVAVFVVNFIAIIPLAAMLSFVTEEIALRTGETLGGLLNATFGNAVELIVAIIALIDNQITVVKTSLIGSILSNLLLVMGCCFFFGALRREEQFFNTTVAQTAASLLALAAAGVIIPTVFDSAQKADSKEVASLSRGTAIILLLVYAAYLFFQLKTHQRMFRQESQKVAAKPWSHGGLGSGAVRGGLAMPGSLIGHAMPDQDENARLSRLLATPPQLDKAGEVVKDNAEEPQLHFWVALAALAGSTTVIAICAEFMVDSIDAVTKAPNGSSSGALSVEFVGLILLPIVGNAAEHATAVTVAIKDKMDLAIGVAIGSSMQVALFLIPLLVVIGWCMDKDEMDLSFDNFQVAIMFVAVLLINYLIGDGKSHWLEGFLLISLYAIIAVCAFYYPNSTAE